MGDCFKALADPSRRQILKMLKDKDMTAGEIAEHFDMAKPSVTHHLNTLKNAGLITDERQGQLKIYSINMTVFQEVIDWVFSFLDKAEKENLTMETTYEKE